MITEVVIILTDFIKWSSDWFVKHTNWYKLYSKIGLSQLLEICYTYYIHLKLRTDILAFLKQLPQFLQMRARVGLIWTKTELWPSYKVGKHAILWQLYLKIGTSQQLKIFWPYSIHLKLWLGIFDFLENCLQFLKMTIEHVAILGASNCMLSLFESYLKFLELYVNN